MFLTNLYTHIKKCIDTQDQTFVEEGLSWPLTKDNPGQKIDTNLLNFNDHAVTKTARDVSVAVQIKSPVTKITPKQQSV